MNFMPIKTIYFAYTLLTLHTTLYSKPTILEKLLPCCFKSEPESPTASSKKHPLLTSDAIIERHNSTEMLTITHARSSSASSFTQLQRDQSPLAQQTAANITEQIHQELSELLFQESNSSDSRSSLPLAPPPSLSRGSSQDSFVMVTPTEKE